MEESTGDWKVASTGRLESLPYMKVAGFAGRAFIFAWLFGFGPKGFAVRRR
jgi:hypothetical protein